jgi:hypothetical protein
MCTKYAPAKVPVKQDESGRPGFVHCKMPQSGSANSNAWISPALSVSILFGATNDLILALLEATLVLKWARVRATTI